MKLVEFKMKGGREGASLYVNPDKIGGASREKESSERPSYNRDIKLSNILRQPGEHPSYI